jgi:hypothetical protein
MTIRLIPESLIGSFQPTPLHAVYKNRGVQILTLRARRSHLFRPEEINSSMVVGISTGIGLELPE